MQWLQSELNDIILKWGCNLYTRIHVTQNDSICIWNVLVLFILILEFSYEEFSCNSLSKAIHYIYYTVKIYCIFILCIFSCLYAFFKMNNANEVNTFSASLDINWNPDIFLNRQKIVIEFFFFHFWKYIERKWVEFLKSYTFSNYFFL